MFPLPCAPALLTSCYLSESLPIQHACLLPARRAPPCQFCFRLLKRVASSNRGLDSPSKVHPHTPCTLAPLAPLTLFAWPRPPACTHPAQCCWIIHSHQAPVYATVSSPTTCCFESNCRRAGAVWSKAGKITLTVWGARSSRCPAEQEGGSGVGGGGCWKSWKLRKMVGCCWSSRSIWRHHAPSGDTTFHLAGHPGCLGDSALGSLCAPAVQMASCNSSSLSDLIMGKLYLHNSEPALRAGMEAET